MEVNKTVRCNTTCVCVWEHATCMVHAAWVCGCILYTCMVHVVKAVTYI